MIRSYYRCCCINEPVIFSLKLKHRFHALLAVWSDHDDIVPLSDQPIKVFSVVTKSFFLKSSQVKSSHKSNFLKSSQVKSQVIYPQVIYPPPPSFNAYAQIKRKHEKHAKFLDRRDFHMHMPRRKSWGMGRGYILQLFGPGGMVHRIIPPKNLVSFNI